MLLPRYDDRQTCTLTGYPLTTAMGGEWTTTTVDQWTAGFLPGLYWQLATLASSQAPGVLLEGSPLCQPASTRSQQARK